jgi:hypothetical protein
MTSPGILPLVLELQPPSPSHQLEHRVKSVDSGIPFCSCPRRHPFAGCYKPSPQHKQDEEEALAIVALLVGPDDSDLRMPRGTVVVVGVDGRLHVRPAAAAAVGAANAGTDERCAEPKPAKRSDRCTQPCHDSLPKPKPEKVCRNDDGGGSRVVRLSVAQQQAKSLRRSVVAINDVEPRFEPRQPIDGPVGLCWVAPGNHSTGAIGAAGR